MGKLMRAAESEQDLLRRLHDSWAPFSLGWDGHAHEGNKVYFVRARGRGRISGKYKSERAALRLAVRMSEDYERYIAAMQNVGRGSSCLRGFPN